MSEKEEQSEPKKSLSLKIRDIELDDSWPCGADILERHKEIENLTPVFLNVDAPLVFAIDAPWGGGKTTFIRLWQHYLSKEQNGAVSLYFNAWENDFSDDPLLPMLAEFDDWLSADKGKAKKLWKKTKDLVPGLLKRGAIVTAKMATLGGLDLDKEYEKLAADYAGDMTNDLVSGFKSHKSILEEFKINLGELTKALPEGQKNLIVFVDELDRCRPTYAIETLERIKHLFDIPNIVFVLAVNKEQLGKSIQGVYGSNFDGLNYLKRFIDMEYSLREQPVENIVRASLNSLSKALEKRKKHRDELRMLERSLIIVSKKFEYQIRDIQQLTARLNLVLRTFGDSNNLVALLIPLLLALRQENPSLYKQYSDGDLVANEVIEFLLGVNSESDVLPRDYGFLAGWLIKASFDPRTEKSLKVLISPWEEQQERFEQNSEEFREVGKLLRVAGDDNSIINGHSIGQRISKSCFEAIEFIDEIRI